jgi:hypothetical protein
MKKGIRDLNWIMVSLALLIVAIVVMCVGGCSANYAVGDRASHAGFKLNANPLSKSLSYNANGETRIKKLEYDPNNQKVVINEFYHSQDSAEASKYDAAIIEKTGVAQEWQVKWVKESWTGFTAWTHELVPVLQLLASGKFVNTSSGFNIEIPGYGTLGKTKTTDASQVQAIIQRLANQAEKIEKSATTQPTK